jgi:hypothetical protein
MKNLYIPAPEKMRDSFCRYNGRYIFPLPFQGHEIMAELHIKNTLFRDMT